MPEEFLTFPEYQLALQIDEAVRHHDIAEVRVLLSQCSAVTKDKILSGADFIPADGDRRSIVPRIKPVKIAAAVDAPWALRKLLVQGWSAETLSYRLSRMDRARVPIQVM